MQYSFCIDVLRAWKMSLSYIHCVPKLAGAVGASLYCVLVIVTGSSIARCAGRSPATLCKWPSALTCTLHCSVLMLLSNRKMLHCNGPGSLCVPGDQELLKSGHWNSISWFITMNCIDPVYTEDLIWQSIKACALLRGTKCVFLFALPQSEMKSVSGNVGYFVEWKLRSPQSTNCSNITSVWYNHVSQGRRLKLGRPDLQGAIENAFTIQCNNSVRERWE